ncbi:unnamed protein product [Allacma fusca]|uniref:Uncharacterized protein n=1 Tax=Allacma fusca TaxID=39272 RepID=A0A8J2LPM2_9HEXA|nr:unnamed protein product [Allacma fusca]
MRQILVLFFLASVTSTFARSIRVRRGYGGGGGGGLGGYAPGYGSGPAGQAAGAGAVGAINQHQGVALWSAQSAVAAAVGRDYQNQVATTTQFVNQFTAPVTKGQAQEAFNAVRHQQQGSYISGALAANSPAISAAADVAAKDNFAQAYQAAQGSTLSAAAADAAAQQSAYLAGSALAAQHVQAAHAAAAASAAKTQQTLVNAHALQAINGVAGVDRAASYSFSGGGGGGGGGYGK